MAVSDNQDTRFTASITGNSCAFCGLPAIHTATDQFGRRAGVDEQKIDSLTDRQKDCLRLVGRGFTSKEIGRLLDLSPSTVDNHVNGAVQVLDAPNRGTAARALDAFETRQKLPRQSPDIASAAIFANQSSIGTAERPSPNGSFTLSLPPVGGKRNDLDRNTRSLRILQVAVVAAVVAIALTIMIAGLFRTFG